MNEPRGLNRRRAKVSFIHSLFIFPSFVQKYVWRTYVPGARMLRVGSQVRLRPHLIYSEIDK